MDPALMTRRLLQAAILTQRCFTCVNVSASPSCSSKFSRKVRFVDSLEELSQLVSLKHTHIPDCVRQ